MLRQIVVDAGKGTRLRRGGRDAARSPPIPLISLESDNSTSPTRYSLIVTVLVVLDAVKKQDAFISALYAKIHINAPLQRFLPLAYIA